MILIPCEDLRQDRKRRVVDDDAPVGIILSLIIAARIKRTDDLAILPPVFLNGPVFHRVINSGRGVTVVGCELWLEFVLKLVVLFIPLAVCLCIVDGLGDLLVLVDIRIQELRVVEIKHVHV